MTRQTFDLKSCRDLVEKLAREIDRMRDHPTRDDLTDHAVNFAITGWHLTDWVWNAICRHPDKLAAIARGDGLRPSELRSCEDFKRYVRSKPGLAVCHDIATAAKHVRRRLCDDRI